MGKTRKILAVSDVYQQSRKLGARLGARVMSQLFHQLARPMATGETLGVFLNGLRIVVIDGTCFDVPDSDENARDMERPSSRPGTVAAFARIQISHLGRSRDALNI